MSAPISEQEICVSCGFCCDHTIFDIVIIQKDEFVGEKFTSDEIMVEGERYFKLPCPYFDSKCTMYEGVKPKRCSEFRCELLKSVEHKELPRERAFNVISEIRLERDSIIANYHVLSGEKITFRGLVKKFEQAEIDKETLSDEMISLNYRVNLLKIHISKWFRSKQEFERLYSMD